MHHNCCSPGVSSSLESLMDDNMDTKYGFDKYIKNWLFLAILGNSVLLHQKYGSPILQPLSTFW